MIDVRGLNVVVTGTIAGESRNTATAKLQDAGANVQSAVTSTTDLLVTGAKVGQSKMAKAASLGARVVSWDDVWRTDPASPAAPPVPAAPPAAAVARPVRQVAPQLAKGADLPVGDGWLYEVKWDGVRGVVTVRDGEVTMQSRSGKTDYVEQFPHLVADLCRLPDCVIDGEIVVLDAARASCFQSLGSGTATYVVFDQLEDGEVDLRGDPLEDRRSVLEATVAVLGSRFVAASPAFDDGEALLATAMAQGLEGIVAKRRQSRYQEGARTSDWVKVKVRCEQEFVVAGWLPGEGALLGSVGSFLLGVFNGVGELVYCGKVGTGGDRDVWDAIRDRLTPVLFSHPDAVLVDLRELSLAERKEATWVLPEVVVQVAFQRWTNDGRLWHPSFKGERHDKPVQEVVRERAGVAA